MFPSLFVSITLLALTSALTQDQAGKLDWIRQGTGVPTQAQLHPRKPRLLAATDANVLVHLNLRNGEVVWRQKMDNPIEELQLPTDSFVLTKDRRSLRMWSQSEGTVKWEQMSESIEAFRVCENRLVVSTGKRVEVKSVTDGAAIWSTRHDMTGCSSSTVYCKEERAKLVSNCKKGEVKISVFDLETGEVVSKAEYSVEGAEKVSGSRVIGDYLIVLAAGKICWIVLDGKGEGMVCEETEMDFSFVEDALVGIDRDKKIASLSLLDGGRLKEVCRVEKYLIHSDSVDIGDHHVIGFLSKSKTSGLQIDVRDASTGQIELSEVYDCPNDFVPLRIFLGTYKRKDKSNGFRFLLVGKHGDIILLQQERVVWQREESLSAVSSAVLVDPPLHLHHTPSRSDLTKWIRSQILNLKIQFQISSTAEKEELAALKIDLSGKTLASKDQSGYRKYIIALTRYNTISAVHNGDGRVMWQTKLPDLFDGVMPWGFSHGEKAPTVLAYKIGNPARLLVIDAHSGVILDSVQPLNPVNKIIKLPKTTQTKSGDQVVIVLIDLTSDQSPVGSILPQIGSLDKETVDNLFFWQIEKESGRVRGYGIDGESTSDRIVFGLRWELNLGNKVLAVSERGSEDPVYSYTKVLGDRSLLFKYLNPNIALIVTGESGPDPGDESIEAFLIDTVTGRILFRQVHESAKGPVHGIVSQHWAAYHYFSTSNRRYQITTVELYDASHRQLAISDVLKGTVERENISSFNPIPIKSFSATFFVGVGVKSLAVTKTLRGITTQQLLMATTTDQIYAMNKRLLDPRRPVRATIESKEERLIPYTETLPIFPIQFASYNHYIQSLQGVISSPAGLESGTHLFAYGDDLYYTRLQPERGFDTLDEDFNYGFLLLTLLAMLIASVVSHRMVSKAKLTRKWK